MALALATVTLPMRGGEVLVIGWREELALRYTMRTTRGETGTPVECLVMTNENVMVVGSLDLKPIDKWTFALFEDSLQIFT